MENSYSFSVIYSFKIHSEFEFEFIETWNELTNLIYKFEGSLGSRLQKVDSNLYLGYALWPDKKTFYHASNNEIELLKHKQKKYVVEVKRVFESEIISDLIMNSSYNDNLYNENKLNV
jgi:hypothetical protein